MHRLTCRTSRLVQNRPRSFRRQHGGPKRLKQRVFVELPRDRRLADRPAQMSHKCLAGDLPAAKRRQMRRILLAVYHLYFMVTQVSDERRERDFRGIGAMREHRFAEKHAPERHAIKTAYALALEPRFNAVRPSRSEEHTSELQ